MAQKTTPTQGGLREQILKEGKLCISKNDKLYIGIPSTTFNKPEHVVEYNNIKGRILESFVSFTKPLKMPDEGIFVDILKPFSNPSAMNTSVDYFDCIKDFISIEILFMFVLKHKFSEDYSKFMNLCNQNRHKIQWDTEDKEGNTMLHYVTIMSQYPEHACDIIQYIKGIPGYNYLINKTNKYGIIPLASSLQDKFICDNAKKIHHIGIINELVQAGANLLLKTQNSSDYVWKGGPDSIFFVLNGDPSILVTTKLIATNEGKKFRICCNLKEPPECRLHCVTKLNTIDLFPNYLEQVINFPCTQIAKTLFTKKYCNFDTKMPDGTMVLHHIIQVGSEELVHYMFEQKPYLLHLDKNYNSILHLAILTKNEKRAILILKLLSDPILIQMLDYQNKYNQTPLDLIMVANLPNLNSALNTRIPSFISRSDENCNSLLHRAVIWKCTDVLRYLAEQKEIEDIVNAKNSNGDTAIMLCIQNKFVDGFPIILSITQCNVNETNYRGYTLLHLAIIHFEEKIFSLLLQDLVNNNRFDVINRVIRPTQSTSDKFAALLLTPLLLCMYHEHFSAARLLIQQGATIDTPDCEGNSFNHYLIKHCHNPAELKEFFKVKLSKLNFQSESPSNISDIQLLEHCVIHAISYRNLLALKTLINYNKDVINISSVHLPILHYAICKQFDEGVKFLLSLGLPLAIKKTEQNFTLHKDRLQKQNISLEFTESKVCYRLSNGYVMTDIPGFTKTEYYGIMHLPSVVNKNALLKNLVLCGSIEPIESYLCTNTPSLSVNDKALLSLISSQFATQEIMLYLLNENCPSFSFDWSAKDSSGNTVVHVGVFNTCISTFLSMLEGLRIYQSKQWRYISDVILDIRNVKNKTALELAIFENNSEAFDALIKHGASLVTKDRDQNNILHNFCTCKNAEISYFDRILVEITKLKKDLINEYNNIGYTPLHTAVNTCNIQAYRKSIALPSCRYDAVTKQESNNIVHLAIKNGSPELLKQIIEDLKNRENMKDEGNKLINKTNKKSLTPQFLAVECGNIDLFHEILEFSGVDSGASPLHSAVKYSNKSNEHLNMINVILSKRKEMLNTKDNSNETPLHYAVKLKMEKALHLLLASNSIDLSCQNHQGMTALHLAIQSNTNILRAILNKIDTPQSAHLINTQDFALKTALHHCIEQTMNSEDELSLLLSKNPDLSVVDKYSNNVLHYAAMKKSRIKYLQTLLRHINENCPDILQVLLSKQNQQINTPLYCAIQNSNVNGVDELLKVNASLPVVDKEGTITLCNRKPFPHIDVPIRIYKVRITNKPELRICVGFTLSEQQWILSDLPNLSITYLTHKNPSYSSHEVVEIQTITETVLTSYLLPCQCCEPLEIFINEVKNQIFNKNAKLMHLAAAHGSIQIVKFLMEYFGANIPFLDEDEDGYSIIHYSIENTHSEILRLLCDRMKNVFPEEFTKLSSKLLHFCITKGSHIESFTILLGDQYEAIPSSTDEHDVHSN
ncbi:Ankyrin repeat protein [Oopsacas minuta]|uniref:Ankyrin repeat protein n=1 Tax=Oopsacas minuta TaxID=111878 RepID=A0AAV7KC20_9METZ|nr:Ankyrin repeat protein [Oopsacas minuta]